MKTYLQVNIAEKTVALLGGSEWKPADAAFGEELTLALRFIRTTESGTVEHSEDVRALRATIGRVDARPEGGTAKLQIGSGASTPDNTTALLAYGSLTAKGLQSSINALSAVVATYGAATVTYEDGSYVITFANAAAQVPLKVVANRLFPVSFGRVNAWQVDEQWVHELRFTQAPVAFSDSAPRVLPPAPSITTVQNGGSEAGASWNEIQALYIPPEFRGTYQIKRDFTRTGLLSRSDGPEEIKTALSVIDGGFAVTNPSPNTAHIEFGGEMEGQDWDPLEIVVKDAPEGDMTFTLSLAQAELWVMLRRQAEVELPLEVWLDVADADGVVRTQMAFTVPITLQRPVYFEELATVPNINWEQPPSPKDYIPFTLDEILTGTQSWAGLVGDGVSSEITKTHGLGTENIVSVALWENSGDTRKLVDGVDYRVRKSGPNSIVFSDFAAVPGVNAYLAVVEAAGPKSAFESHTHTIAQIVDLQTTLDDLGGRVQTLEDRFPPDVSVTVPETGETLKMEIKPATLILHATAAQLAAGVDALPTRGPFMLPAIQKTSPTTLPTPLPDAADTAGTVWESDRSEVISGGGFIRSSNVLDGDFVGSDGRILYPVSRRGTTTTYFPKPFEKVLWEVAVNDKMLTAGKTLTARFGLELQLLHADSEAQWMVVIEKGTPTDEVTGTPDTSATDLWDVEWDEANPLVRQRVILTGNKVTHQFGALVVRSSTAITASGLVYGAAVSATAPATANFVLRARLIDFDVKNSVPNARGWVVASLVTPSSGTLGVVIG